VQNRLEKLINCPLGEFYYTLSKTAAPIGNWARPKRLTLVCSGAAFRHGWHKFRRGLATNLCALKVPPKVIQAILQHAAVETTFKHCVILGDEQNDSAMKRLTREMNRKGLDWGTNGVQAKPKKSRK
jgi:hypothetical protein